MPALALAAAVHEAAAKGRKAHPSCRVDERVFAKRLLELVQGKEDPLKALRALSVDDLYLTFACSRGDPMAIIELSQARLAKVIPVIERVHRSADFVDEVLQALRRRLLVGEQ